MSPERWQQVTEIFQAALTRPENDRGAFIAEACERDPGLQHEVEAMLQAHDQAASFMEAPVSKNVAGLFADELKPTLKPGQIFAHYRILSRLGAGGMGEVYLAADTRLGRQVALKILPSTLSKDVERLRRFQQEARAASMLNHPNILTIHEVGQIDSVPYLATEFIAGVTLRQRLASQIEIKEAIETAMQIASALVAAHQAGIVHRDIKPENLMLRADGYLKVLDFGLAKPLAEKPAVLDPEEATKALVRTGQGVVMGTVTYMSPEQARATATDERTDLWSLGVVLYEMVTGHVPFEGVTPHDLTASILKTEPLPLSARAPEVPAELERIVGKALTKDRDERYQTARDLLADLRRLKRQQETSELQDDRGTTETAPAIRDTNSLASTPAETTPVIQAASSAEYLVTGIRRHKIAATLIALALAIAAGGLALYLQSRSAEAQIESIAVLPFKNQSNNPDADYISDGVAESINNALTRLPNLKVVPYSVAFHYKNKGADLRKIGAELSVSAVLTGRVLQRGDNVTISVELDDVRHGKQVWGEQYNRKVADLLVVQNEIAAEISQRLRSQLSGDEKQKLTKGSTQNPEAYQLYLKGNFYVSKYTKEGMLKGIDYYNQAIALDPNYALAYSGRSYAYWNTVGWYFSSNDVMPKAKDAAQRALAIDDTLGDAHLALAAVAHWYDWDWATAEKEFQKAIQLNPESQRIHGFYSWFLAIQGRIDPAIAEGRRSVQLDPLSPEPYTFLGFTFYFARQHDRAIEQLKKAIEVDPAFWMAHDFLGRAYEAKGQWPEAIAEFQRALELERNNGENLSNLAHAYAMTRRPEEARKILDQLKQYSTQNYVDPYYIATVYAGLGEKEQAFAYLDRAIAERSFAPAFYLSTDFQFDNLRSDPRFSQMLQRTGLPR